MDDSEDEVEREIQKGLRYIAEKEQKDKIRSTSLGSVPTQTRIATSVIPPPVTRKPLFTEGSQVQVRRENNLWSVGRILFGGVRSDCSYDIEFEDGKVDRRVSESNLREYVPRREDDYHSDDDIKTSVKPSTKRSAESAVGPLAGNERKNRPSAEGLRVSGSSSSSSSESTSSSTSNSSASRNSSSSSSAAPTSVPNNAAKELTKAKELATAVMARDRLELQWVFECLLAEIARTPPTDPKLVALTERQAKSSFTKKVLGSSKIATFDELYNLLIVLQDKITTQSDRNDANFKVNSVTFEMVKKMVTEINLKRAFPKISSSVDTGASADGEEHEMNRIPPSTAAADWEYIKNEAKTKAAQPNAPPCKALTTDVKSLDSLMGMT
eukprot:gene31225-38585_t